MKTDNQNPLVYRIYNGWDELSRDMEKDNRDVFPLNRLVIRSLARIFGLLQDSTEASNCSTINWSLLERPDKDFELVINEVNLSFRIALRSIVHTTSAMFVPYYYTITILLLDRMN